MKIFTPMLRHRAFMLYAAILLMLPGLAGAQTLISQGKNTYASTTEAGYPPGNATDGNSTTKWSSQSANYNQKLFVDLGATYDIDKVLIYFADGRYAVTFDIQVSDDSIHWTTVRTIPPTNTRSSLAILGIVGSGRYVQFNGRGRANTAGYRISEFKVYGTLQSTASQITDMQKISSRLNYGYATQETQDLRNLANSMNPDGSWNIPYGGSSWLSHALRLRRMAAAYNNPANAAYHYSTIPAKFMLGFRYFIAQHFTSPDNWYDTTIQAPNNLIIGLMLMKPFIPKDSLFIYANYVVDDSDNPDHRGANRVWVSGITLRKGLALERYPLTSKGYSGVGTALDLVSGNNAEGLMNDGSFHQHNDQLYNNGYGKGLITDASIYIRAAYGTPVDTLISSARKTNLINMALNGNQLMVYRATDDFGTIGRGISGPDGLTSLDAGTIDTLKANDPTHATDYQNWKDHRAGAAFPTAYIGNKYFWRSAIVTSHGANYYMSAKVISTRTEGTEDIRSANQKGYNLPLGATNIMTSGNEYLNIFAAWNWSCVPGTTAEMSEAATKIPMPGGYLTGVNSFGGGASAGDMGAIAYEHNYNSITAKKSYFFLEDKMVCMGNGITGSKSNEVITTINQTLTSGTVSYNDGTTHNLTDSLTANTIQWIHHDNVAYLFPLGGFMTMTNRDQHGKWSDLDLRSSDTTTHHANIFRVYFRHSPTPTNRSYNYIVVPNKLLSDVPALAANSGITIVTNTVNIHAIRFSATGANSKYAAIFYNPGTVDVGEGLKITSDSKAVVLVKKYSTQFRVSVSDPTYSLSTINITLNYNGTDLPVVAIPLPTGTSTGSTITRFVTYTGGSLAVMQNGMAQQTTLTQDPAKDSKQIFLYPNPANSVINVNGLDGPKDIEVYDLSGHKYSKVHGTSVNISGLFPGTKYFLSIYMNGQVIVRQFIKQ